MNTVGLEYVRCNLCGADDSELLFHAPVRPDQAGLFARDVWNVVRCKHCHLIYVNPRMNATALEKFYSFDNPTDMAFVQGWFIENADLQQTTWKRLLRLIRCDCPSGSVLDVGCGAGSFLSAARDMGYQVLGQEVAPHFIDYCRTQIGLKVLEGELETLDLEPASFDCVTAFDVIEHHPDPLRLLHAMRRLLKPGGFVILSTHDIGNLFARWYGARWRYIAPIGHLTYFTQETLGRMVTACGLRVVKQGGSHTIDDTLLRETRNYVVQSVRLLLLRALVLSLYKPLASRLPFLTHWQIRVGGGVLNHEKLLTRAGSQIIMNDDMVLIARAV
jgi:2-polyprenyl-3-methyl-5-hydroxy-6-metoxy-1,4-benzoquinol methylase